MLRTLLVRTLFVGLAIGTWVVAGPAHAATRTWDGGTGVGDGSNWTTPANWVGDVAPVPGADDLVFAGANDTATNNNFLAGSQFNGITFDVGASPFTAGGNSMVLGGNIVNNSPNAQSLSLPIVLGGLSSTAINGTSQITTGAANLTLSGLSRTALSGQATVFTTGGGTINTSLTNDASGILGAWATIGSEWATSSGGNVIAYSGYSALAGAPAIVSNATANYKWSGATGNATMAAAGAVTTDINSLVFTDTVARTVTVASGATLRVGPAGGIFKTDSTTGTGSTLTIGATGSILTAGGPTANTPGELILNGNSITPDVNGIVVASTVNNNGTGAVTVVKTGNAAVQFNAAGNYSGGSYIQSGRLRANNATSYGTGNVYVASGAQGYAAIGANTMTNNFFLSGKGFNEGSPVFSGGALRLANGGTTIAGTVTLMSDARITSRGAGTTGGIITGKITGPYALDFSGAQITTLHVLTLANSANDWTGDTTLFNGALRIGGTGDVIPNGVGKGNVIINGEAGSTIKSFLDLNARTETINGLSSAGDLANAVVHNNTAGTGTLRVGDNNATANFGGILQNGPTAASMITAIEKVGGGTQTLSGENLHTGATTVTGGTLALQSAISSNNISGSTTINVGPSGTLNVTGLVGGEIQVASGQSLVNNGIVTGVVTAASGSVKGTGNYGTVNISGGTLAPGGSVGTVAINNLAMSAGIWQVEVNGTSADRVNATTATFSGGNIDVVPTGAATGTSYTIFSGAYTGTVPSILDPTIGRLTFGLDTTTANTIKLTQTGVNASLRWDTTGGTGDNVTWDAEINQNWKTVPGGADERFFDFDSVLFNDSNGGSYSVTVAGSVKPLSIAVDNSAGDYTIGGSGTIDGSSGITKSGTRSLTLSGANNYTGATVVNGGVLSTSSLADGGFASDIGAATADASNLVINGATFRYSGTGSITNRGMTIGTGGATIDADGTGALELNGAKVMAGTNTARTVTLTGDSTNLNKFTGIGDNGSGVTTVVKSGPGTWLFESHSYTGPTNIQQGTVIATSNAAFGLLPGGDVTVSGGATLDIGGNTVNNNANFGQKHFKIAGTGVGNVGALINGNTTVGVGQQNAFQKVTLTANATVGAYGRFDLRGGPPVLDLAGFTLNKKGAAHFGIVSGIITDGNVVVDEGLFALEAATSAVDFGSGKKFTFNTGTRLQFFSTTGGTITRPMEFNGAVNVHQNSGANTTSTFASPILINGSATASFTFQNTGSTLNANGAISGPGSLVVESTGAAGSQPGTVVLGGNNTYAGTTTINGGTLRVNGTHSGGGLYTLASGARLGGSGTIAPGAGTGIAIPSGGILAPGVGVGTLTLDGGLTSSPVLTLDTGATLEWEVAVGPQADRIALVNGAAGDIAFNNNTLTFTDLSAGLLTTGNYTLFSANVAGAYSGLTVDGSNNITTGLAIGGGLEAYGTPTLKLLGNNIVLGLVGGAILQGDYNANGVVDAADYVVWRENAGTTNALPNDPTGGTIGTTQYNSWRSNFGNSIPGSGSTVDLGNAGVPEPGAVVLALFALVGALFLRSRGV